MKTKKTKKQQNKIQNCYKQKMIFKKMNNEKLSKERTNQKVIM